MHVYVYIYTYIYTYMAVCQNPGTCSSHQNSWDLWMFIPLKMLLIGFNRYWSIAISRSIMSTLDFFYTPDCLIGRVPFKYHIYIHICIHTHLVILVVIMVIKYVYCIMVIYIYDNDNGVSIVQWFYPQQKVRHDVSFAPCPRACRRGFHSRSGGWYTEFLQMESHRNGLPGTGLVNIEKANWKMDEFMVHLWDLMGI